MLYLYNSLTRRKEKFAPINKNKVKIYVCGITPYDTTHLGHAFTYVFFDVLIRYLQFKGYNVTYIQNVTDIDDDILRRAKEENRDWKELGDFWTNKFLKDMKALNVQKPSNFVKATDSIFLMIRIIKVLIKKGLAYEKSGNVYFEIKKFKNYGQLSGFNANQMKFIAKERGGNPDDPLKKEPLDFLLWQKSKPHEPSWQSAWGKGRPGWHIECSAMIKKYLGDQIDIHGGGRDLIFPHHESEIAQSESYTNKKPFVKYWLHTAMLLHLGEKMAKSLGNLVMVDSLLKKYSANEIRWFLLSHHYRKPWEFEEREFEDIKQNLLIVKKTLEGVNKTKEINNLYMKKFLTLMDDGLNTPQALAFIINLAKKTIKGNKNKAKIGLQQTFLKCLLILGFRF